jgi:23S rRNA pseudouridine1911/1915/1917 synthase
VIEILYEDDALIFVDKPPDLIVQRAYDANEPTLYDVVAAHTSPLFLMQRLDRGTSGVMFFSKRADVNAKLTRQFETRRIQALSRSREGELAENQTVDTAFARIGPISFGVREGGKRAITTLRSLSATPPGSLVEVRLHTGRTHQIRVHLAAIGHPIIGDWLYGTRNAARPMLHAAELAMVHPLTNAPLRVAAAPPADFRTAAEEREIVYRDEDIMTPHDYS